MSYLIVIPNTTPITHSSRLTRKIEVAIVPPLVWAIHHAQNVRRTLDQEPLKIARYTIKHKEIINKFTFERIGENRKLIIGKEKISTKFVFEKLYNLNQSLVEVPVSIYAEVRIKHFTSKETIHIATSGEVAPDINQRTTLITIKTT